MDGTLVLASVVGIVFVILLNWWGEWEDDPDLRARCEAARRRRRQGGE